MKVCWGLWGFSDRRLDCRQIRIFPSPPSGDGDEDDSLLWGLPPERAPVSRRIRDCYVNSHTFMCSRLAAGSAAQVAGVCVGRKAGSAR